MASPNGFTNDGDVPKEQAGSADGVLGDADSDVPYEETKEDVETLKSSEDLLTKLESGFSALMNAAVGKFGQQLSGAMNTSLECSICKELIIQAVFRMCEHSFCYHCLIHWTTNSYDCPICRDDVCVGVTNPLIDGVVNLLVDLTFNEDEKKERSSIIQQRLSPSAMFDYEHPDAFLQQNNLVLVDPKNISANYSLIRRYFCIKQAWKLISEIFENEEMCQQMKMSTDDERITDEIVEMFNSFGSDYLSLKVAMLNNRFLSHSYRPADDDI